MAKYMRAMLLALFIFSIGLLLPPPAEAATTQLQVDSGQFNCWLHSDGTTWQNVPGYGVVKPGDTITYSYTISYDGPEETTGVKSVRYYAGDETTYNQTYRQYWQPYGDYTKPLPGYDKYAVTSLTVNSFQYLGNGKVQITITAPLVTATKTDGYYGLKMKENWQGALTQGRKFYLPTVIEWELAQPSKTAYDLTMQISGEGSTTPIGSPAPGTVHKGLSGNITLKAVPQAGWKFAYWFDVLAGNSFATTTTTTITMDKDKTIRAVFIRQTGQEEGSASCYITVVPCQKTIFVDESQNFQAYWHDEKGKTTNITNTATWSISDTSKASLSTTTKGRVTGKNVGKVVLTASKDGLSGTADVTIVDVAVEPPNYKPKADFEISNPSPVEGEEVFFTDTSSHPGQSYGESIVKYEWTIQEQPSATTKDTKATWLTTGTYQITLKVEDQDGDSDTCTKSVVVGPALPAAVITVSNNHIILGREVHIDGDQSTAALNRSIKWDEMQWEFYNPSGVLAYQYTGRYPLGKGTPNEKALTNSVLKTTGQWQIKLKVKDSENNESEWTTELLFIYPDQPPIADFWVAEESLRNSYEGTTLTVYDRSKAADPDAALGDSIFKRTWTLYYDANNNGSFTDSVDEVITVGTTGKAAVITQTSTNDPKPVIKFTKTGRYKLELTVQEQYDSWGTMTAGLSANTNSKATAEKTVTVINIAPTVAFDVKKKVPVDVLFAADYSLSDAKYNSLISGQPGFKNTLIGADIDPTTTTEKVAPGAMSENFELHGVIPQWYHNTGWQTGEYRPAKRVTNHGKYEYDNDYRVVLFEDCLQYWTGSDSEVVKSTVYINPDTGKCINGYTMKLDDGTFLRGDLGKLNYYALEDFGHDTNVDRVDKNGNVLISKAQYLQTINNHRPAETDGWQTYCEGYKCYYTPDGSFYVLYYQYKNEFDSYYYRCLVKKFDKDLNLVWTQTLLNNERSYGKPEWDYRTSSPLYINYLGYCPVTDRLFFEKKFEYAYSSYLDDYNIMTVGNSGITRLTGYPRNRVPLISFNNGILLVLTYSRYLEIYNSTNIVSSTYVGSNIGFILEEKFTNNSNIFATCNRGNKEIKVYLLDLAGNVIKEKTIENVGLPLNSYWTESRVISPGLALISLRDTSSDYWYYYNYYLVDENLDVIYSSTNNESRWIGSRGVNANEESFVVLGNNIGVIKYNLYAQNTYTGGEFKYSVLVYDRSGNLLRVYPELCVKSKSM